MAAFTLTRTQRELLVAILEVGLDTAEGCEVMKGCKVSRLDLRALDKLHTELDASNADATEITVMPVGAQSGGYTLNMEPSL